MHTRGEEIFESVRSFAAQPTLVGRENEMRFLREHLDTAVVGKGSLVLIAGEAGIGKTRLVEEFGRFAKENEIHVAIGRCIPGVPIPYLPFQDALKEGFTSKAESTSRVPREVATSRKTGLIGWLRGPYEHREAMPILSFENESTLRSVLELLRNLSAKRSLVVILEDLHWADSASIQLLHFMARNLQDLKLLMIATYRSEELTERRAGVHPLLEALRIMRREGICHEFVLDAWNAEELGLAISSMLGGHVDPELLRRIGKESGGNPLFAVETVRLLANTKAIALQNGTWQSSGTLSVDIPSTIREVILRRVERLPKDERRLVDCAAVIGERFDPVLIEEALSVDRLSLLEKLARIELTSQLIRSSERVYQFSHEKVQRVVYQQIPSLLRTELHKIIAQDLERQTPTESEYGALSMHFLHAKIGPKCVRYSLLAGQDCLARFALDEAVEYFERALSVAGEGSSLLDERLKALEGLGDAHSGLGYYKSAMANYADFLKFSQIPGDKARVLRKSAESSQSRIEIAALLAESESCTCIDPIELGRIKRLRGELNAASGQPTQAESLYREAEELFRQNDSPLDLARTFLSISDLYHRQGKVRNAVTNAEEAAHLFTRVKSVEGEILASERSGILNFHLGLIKEATESFKKMAEIGARLNNYALLADAYFWTTVVYYSIGDFESCSLEAYKARENTLKTEAQTRRFNINSWLARSESRLGRLDEAERLLQENRGILELSPGLNSKTIATGVSFDNAEYLAAKKEWGLSNEKFQKALQSLEDPTIYTQMFRTIMLTGYGEALEKQGLQSEAREQFNAALEIYKQMGNLAHSKRMEVFLARARSATY